MRVNQIKTLLNYIRYYLTTDGIPESLSEQESIYALMQLVPREEWTLWYEEFENVVFDQEVH